MKFRPKSTLAAKLKALNLSPDRHTKKAEEIPPQIHYVFQIRKYILYLYFVKGVTWVEKFDLAKGHGVFG